MNFHYGDKVKVTSGFYEGCEGIVIQHVQFYADSPVQYVVRFGLTNASTDDGYIQESDLELIK